MSLEAIVYNNGFLEILDQLLLPHESKYMKILTKQDAFNAIKDMNVSLNIF
jgi:methylthioribose-1-phosphate isomerase